MNENNNLNENEELDAQSDVAGTHAAEAEAANEAAFLAALRAHRAASEAGDKDEMARTEEALQAFVRGELTGRC